MRTMYDGAVASLSRKLFIEVTYIVNLFISVTEDTQ